jgi:DNA-binding response OmpR family regulator
MAKNKKIVVVEDESFLLKALNMQLLNNGFDVCSAEDGATGLELVRETMPDLVLLDIILPKMNGFDVLKELKKDKKTKKIPIIILSNLGQDEEKKKGLKLGAADYYVKASTSLDTITGKINKILKLK